MVLFKTVGLLYAVCADCDWLAVRQVLSINSRRRDAIRRVASVVSLTMASATRCAKNTAAVLTLRGVM